ncbi:hypothetical protein HANVADRAFT_47853 [Hanseniaspora valbyensis NRRL Y-1626]|uniref:Mitochondrial intermembrane space import and assembly protein 40 n=1 Tax=Hanseniaspora valbyensis NRRL Y-1626 TaxID=766949 RepID=A0A1B7TGK6_9ASCO|nr:hypothetical protein HANVADRAFT_47853 [Hanseniaspora valbyensis NRRL Y-1626]
MLRKTFLQSKNTLSYSNKRTLSSFSRRQVVRQNIVQNTKKFSKRFYSSSGSGHHDNKLEATILNYSVEDILAGGLSIIALKLAYDFVYEEEEQVSAPVEKESKEEASVPINDVEEVREDTPTEVVKDAEEEVPADAVKTISEDTSSVPVNDVEEIKEDAPAEVVKDAQEEVPGAVVEEIKETPSEAAPIETEEDKKDGEAAETGNKEASFEEQKTAEDATSTAAAYNPETGEINWDCPCLGGMAHGPCGEEFKDAFSCFIYSEAEPKGVDCIGKFQGMQECFKKHPEVYAEQLKDDEPAAVSPVVEQEVTETLTKEEQPAPVETVEEILVGDLPAAVVEEVIVEKVAPVTEKAVAEEGVSVVEEKITIHADPETIEELVEEGLPINAED